MAHVHSARRAQMHSNGGRTFEGQGTPQPRSNYSQPSAPPRQYQNNSRGGFNSSGSSRPTLNMQQPVVTPRGGGSYSGRPCPARRAAAVTEDLAGAAEGEAPILGRPMPSAPAAATEDIVAAPSGGGSYSPAHAQRAQWRRIRRRRIPCAFGGGSHGGNSGGGSHGGSSGAATVTTK